MAYSQVFFSLLILLIDFSQVLGIDKTKIVNTKQGKVKGHLASNELYYEFCGIKYAVVKNRYQVSLPFNCNMYVRICQLLLRN